MKFAGSNLLALIFWGLLINKIAFCISRLHNYYLVSCGVRDRIKSMEKALSSSIDVVEGD
jgi:hypothetical protein